MSKNNKKKETGLYNKDKTDITLNNNSEEYLFIRSFNKRCKYEKNTIL